MRKRPNQTEIQMLLSKFVLNLPEKQFKEERVWIHFERAYFFYLDQMLKLQSLHNMTEKINEEKQMFMILNDGLPEFLKIETNRIENIIRTPTFIPLGGVIILSKNLKRMLLVQARGNQVFGFPKGKMNEAEYSEDCAERQLHEETGLILKLIPNKKILITLKKECIFFFSILDEGSFDIERKNKQLNSLINFHNEISSLEWVDIDKVNHSKTLNAPSRAALEEFLKQRKKGSFQPNQTVPKSPFEEFKDFDHKKYKRIIM